MPESISLPDGWTLDDSPDEYSKLVKRDAVTVPERYSREAYTRDCVIIVTDSRTGVAKGPGARIMWAVENPLGVAVSLADVLDDWISEGGDPYGSPELTHRLETAVAEATQ